MTASLPALELNIQRARYFLQIHADTTAEAGRGSPPARFRELPRAAVVFAVGALDAYLSEVSAEVMIAQVEHAQVSGQSRSVLAAVAKTVPTLALEIALLQDADARIAVAREAIVTHFHENVAQHGSKAVNSTLERLGGSPGRLWQNLRESGYDNPSAELDRWTNMRHAIVHRGQRARVQRRQSAHCVDLINQIAHRVDEEVHRVLQSLQ